MVVNLITDVSILTPPWATAKSTGWDEMHITRKEIYLVMPIASQNILNNLVNADAFTANTHTHGTLPHMPQACNGSVLTLTWHKSAADSYNISASGWLVPSKLVIALAVFLQLCNTPDPFSQILYCSFDCIFGVCSDWSCGQGSCCQHCDVLKSQSGTFW